MGTRPPRTPAVIFGAPRSGTTSLWRYLAEHPDIAESRVKELDFFLHEDADVSAYDRDFPGAGKVTLEASPVYFREHEEIVPRLAKAMPDARLVCVLREPAARLVANYRSQRDWYNRVASEMTFDRFAQIIAEDLDPTPINPDKPEMARYVRDGYKVGLYAQILGHYLSHFAPEQILVLFLDEMKADARGVTQRVCMHIGVDPARMPDMDFRAENQGVNVRNAALFRRLRKVNSRLEPVLNRVPAARRMLKGLHNRLNGAPADLYAQEEGRGRAILRDYYRPANAQLRELMQATWPDRPLPAWVTEAEVVCA